MKEPPGDWGPSGSLCIPTPQKDSPRSAGNGRFSGISTNIAASLANFNVFSPSGTIGSGIWTH